MEYGILEQILMVFDSNNRVVKWFGNLLAKWFPTILGGSIPFITYSFAHSTERPVLPIVGAYAFIIPIVGGLAYSVFTVFKWMTTALYIRGSSVWSANIKAIGFIGLIEVALVMGQGEIYYVSYIALVILTLLNSIATGSSLILESKEKKEIREEAIKQLEEDIKATVVSTLKTSMQKEIEVRLEEEIRKNIFEELEQKKRAARAERARKRAENKNKKEKLAA